MRFGVVVFPGSNCDRDCFYAVRDVLGERVNYIWHRETDINDFDCIILPGGFSYGDYLRTGAIARFSPIMGSIVDFAQRGGLVIGICNGFQVLLEAGLLPGAMLRNRGTHFVCKYVYVRVENNSTPFTNLCSPNRVLKIPIAHNEGNFHISGKELCKLGKNGQIAFRYCSPQGETGQEHNPNGALENIAGITNEAGNVLGMMPHPERSCESALGSEDGLLIFRSISVHGSRLKKS